jgi:hypothetical protein
MYNSKYLKTKLFSLKYFLLPYLFRSLGKGLGCVLIKSTLGPGKTQKGWRLEGEGYAGAMGDKKGQFTSNLGLRRTFPSQLEGAK